MQPAKPVTGNPELSAQADGTLGEVICRGIKADGGWWPFDRFMAAALYTPGLGYYSGHRQTFGRMPEGGSDFVTAPELSPLFGQALAVQLAQALQATGTDSVCEFGAGSGALAEQLLQSLGSSVRRYCIVDVSGTLRQRQAARLARFGDRVQWLDQWPDELRAVVVANEMLDALPVNLLHWDGRQWWERGVALAHEPVDHQDAGRAAAPSAGPRAEARFIWSDRPTAWRPPVDGRTPQPAEDLEMQWARRFAPGTVTEIHPQAQAFMRSLAQRLRQGAAFFIDYGFPEHEFYHPQRTGGTLMCHQAHRADTDPLVGVGVKDITAHVNFTAMALAAQDAGLAVLGYTSQGRFLFNCGLTGLMEQADLAARVNAGPLVHEHEMGELFKVLGLAAGDGFDAIGFAAGDRSHTL